MGKLAGIEEKNRQRIDELLYLYLVEGFLDIEEVTAFALD
jgi:hypothetical protein